MKEETKKNIKGIIIFLLVLVVCVLVAYTTFASIPVSGKSMLPTVEDGDSVLVIRKFVSYERGDVVVFKGEDKNLIKRIIAVGGDVLELKKNDGVLRYYVNGELLEDDYVLDGQYTHSSQESFRITIPEGEFFYLGDNRAVSKDSGTTLKQTEEGKVEVTLGIIDNIIGKVLLRYNFNGKAVIKGVS